MKPLRFFIAKHPEGDDPYIHDVDPDPRTGDARFTFDGPDYSGWYSKPDGFSTEELAAELRRRHQAEWEAKKGDSPWTYAVFAASQLDQWTTEALAAELRRRGMVVVDSNEELERLVTDLDLKEWPEIEPQLELVGLLIGEAEFIPQSIVERHYPFAPPPYLKVRAVFAAAQQAKSDEVIEMCESIVRRHYIAAAQQEVVTCSSCHGTGSVPCMKHTVEDGPDTCSNVDACPWCDGTGFVDDEAAAQQEGS